MAPTPDVRRGRARRLLLVGLAVAVAFAWGVAVGRWRLPPFDLLHATWRTLLGREGAPETVHPALRETHAAAERRAETVDPAALVTVRTPEDLVRRGEELAASLLGPGSEWPVLAMDPEPAGDGPWSLPEGGATGDLIRRTGRVAMPHGVDTLVEFLEVPGGGPWVIVLPGHEPPAAQASLIRALLENGRSVAVVPMPLVPPNPRPEVPLAGGGVLEVSAHGDLAAFERPLRFFLGPAQAVAQHLAVAGEGAVDVVGHSGGAWTAVVLAAVEPYVRATVQACGTLPLHLRPAGHHGDLEVVHRDLTSVAGYLDLYVLGSAGAGRRQLMLHGTADPANPMAHRAPVLAPAVNAALTGLGGGSFEVRLEDSMPGHELSDAAIKVVVEWLDAGE